MSFWHYQKGSLAGWLWFAIVVIVSRAYLGPAIQAVNRQMNFWSNKKGGIASFLLWAIIIIVLIAVLILALRFLFGVI
jgi:hypothetical protein